MEGKLEGRRERLRVRLRVWLRIRMKVAPWGSLKAMGEVWRRRVQGIILGDKKKRSFTTMTLAFD